MPVPSSDLLMFLVRPQVGWISKTRKSPVTQVGRLGSKEGSLMKFPLFSSGPPQFDDEQERGFSWKRWLLMV